MKKKPHNNEIDFYDLIFNLWNNKIKIIIITTAFIISGLLYYHSLEKKLIATTNIKPISTFEAQEYKLFNSLAKEKILNINPTNLLDLFLNKIQTEEIIEDGIIKFDLINKDKFKNQGVYKEQVKKTAISIIDKMLPPLNEENDKKNKSKNNPYWQYNFQIDNVTNWRNFLEYLEKKANEEIRLSLINSFNTEIRILDINSKFKIEDIEQNISNELDDYKTEIANKLAFLKEQAEIARTLNIKKNTLEAANFETDNTVVTNIKSENSYYLKGYEMIEKEISLINSRENEKAFISNLIELEKNKRSILQDKKIERLKLMFLKTPINNINNFKAAKIDFVATKYKNQTNLKKILGISGILGLIISLIYIFLKSIIATRK